MGSRLLHTVIKTCGKPDVKCKQKQPVPKEKVQQVFNCLFEAALYCFFACYKIYDEKTIEVGVFIDRHLYKNMEEVLN